MFPMKAINIISWYANKQQRKYLAMAHAIWTISKEIWTMGYLFYIKKTKSDTRFGDCLQKLKFISDILCESCIMRKSDFCFCTNKGADPLHSTYTADLHTYFRDINSTIPLILTAPFLCLSPELAF